jgi:sugar phosphate isomerase/epimerase
MSDIKRAVSTYSLQDCYARGRRDLEGVFSFLRDIGVEGIEFISDQMIHGTPHPSESTLAEWDRIVGSSPVELVCNDIFINTCLYPNRTLTRKESTRLLIDEIELAHRLGFPMVRLVSKTPNDIIEPALSAAEDKGVVLALEVHAGMSFDHPATKGFIDEIHRLDSPYLGLVVDTGIFCRRHPRVSTEFFRNQGLNPEVEKYIDKIFESGSDPKTHFRSLHSAESEYADEIPEELKKLVRCEADMIYSIFSGGYEQSPFSILDEHMGYVKHFHGKLYEMTDEGVEYSIPYDELIAYLDSKGYDGYIATEYEGQRFALPGQPVQEEDQIEKHQAMLKSYIDASGR